jgi:hypothetical protein
VALDFGGAGEPIAEWDEDTEEFVITENDLAEFRSELMNESDIHAETTYYRLDDEPLDEEIF